MDCLDRTNVAQAALAKDALQRQLVKTGILTVKEKLEDHPEFMHVFRNGELLPRSCPSTTNLTKNQSLRWDHVQYGPIMRIPFRKPIAVLER